MKPEEEALVEAACTAYRARSVDGRIRFHPAWHDLDAEGRQEAFERTLRDRVLEQALDPEGLSTTARAVLRRLGVR
jgi:hypothetical protein